MGPRLLFVLATSIKFLLWILSTTSINAYQIERSLRTPCHDCQVYRQTPQISQPYAEIETHCEYPCNCDTPPQCRVGLPLIRDGCGCCWQCARQERESCNGRLLCDASKSLACVYRKTTDYQGTCVVMEVLKCSVNNQSFHDGETFLLDCRTQCTCNNGTYACVSLCPGESLPPSILCKNPHLTTVTGQCCREWMCDASQDDMDPSACEPNAGDWSSCSAHPCGLGISVRWFLDTSTCEVVNQSRLCQTRPCNHLSPREEELVKEVIRGSRKHHLRRYHSCKATQRYPTPVRLRVSGCISDKKYRPKSCASCQNKCCEVQAATTIPIDFICPLHAVPDILREDTTFIDKRHKKSSILNIFDIMDEGQPILQENDGPPVNNALYLSSLSDDFSSHDWTPSPRESRSGILSEDFVMEYHDESEYWRIKNDNHETIRRQIQWIVRCKCSHICQRNGRAKNHT